MWLSRMILKLMGWKVDVTVPDYPKCIICVAPHTSNWDFIIGKLAYASIGRKACFLMKEQWFFFPLGLVFKAMGGIPVPKKRGSALSAEIVNRFHHSERLALAITPEGTRSLTSKWRTGFLHIALDARVPILLGVIDFGKKLVTITDTFNPTADIDADIAKIKSYYRGAIGRHPEKFTTD